MSQTPGGGSGRPERAVAVPGSGSGSGADPGRPLRRERLSERTISEGTLYGNSKQKVRLSSYQTLGWRIFLSILIFAGIMLAGLIAYAALTYPTINDVVKLAGDEPGQDRLQLWREARAEWVQQLTGVSQLALFGSLVPLLATIAGYLLGQKAAADEDDSTTI